MRQRRFERKNKQEEVSRGQKVHGALSRGVCVECLNTLEDIYSQNENHKKCPVCGWEVKYGLE